MSSYPMSNAFAARSRMMPPVGAPMNTPALGAPAAMPPQAMPQQNVVAQRAGMPMPQPGAMPPQAQPILPAQPPIQAQAPIQAQTPAAMPNQNFMRQRMMGAM
jgi:hypothetical protein